MDDLRGATTNYWRFTNHIGCSWSSAIWESLRRPCVSTWLSLSCDVVLMNHSTSRFFQPCIRTISMAFTDAAHEGVGDRVCRRDAIRRLEPSWLIRDHGDGIFFRYLTQDFIRRP